MLPENIRTLEGKSLAVKIKRILKQCCAYNINDYEEYFFRIMNVVTHKFYS